jgi:multicomponent K+:H+ antiporter subunit G
MTLESLPAWAAVPAALLLILGGLFTAIGAVGLARFGTFFQRMHAPSLGNTLGTGCVLVASVLVSTALANRPITHEILITVFVVITAPMTAMLLMRAAVHRSNVRNASGEKP